MADWGHLDEAAEAKRKVDSPEALGLPHPDELLLIGADPEDFRLDSGKSGAGGRWATIDERRSEAVMEQQDRYSCVAACGETNLSSGSSSSGSALPPIRYGGV